mmetsp:Transcript_23220/g.80522  ORF Transcript_23220/g.80522 Transcript_23220/m.80522 type:complete len:252 (-) Transcript_23220:103-858(-)
MHRDRAGHGAVRIRVGPASVRLGHDYVRNDGREFDAEDLWPRQLHFECARLGRRGEGRDGNTAEGEPDDCREYGGDPRPEAAAGDAVHILAVLDVRKAPEPPVVARAGLGAILVPVGAVAHAIAKAPRQQLGPKVGPVRALVGQARFAAALPAGALGAFAKHLLVAVVPYAWCLVVHGCRGDEGGEGEGAGECGESDVGALAADGAAARVAARRGEADDGAGEPQGRGRAQVRKTQAQDQTSKGGNGAEDL